jgi:hypothetical protein
MKKYGLVATIAFCAGLFAANVQPILSGSGKIIFPEASPSANISASAGTILLQAGGTANNIAALPTGTGWFRAGGAIFSSADGGTFPAQQFIRMSTTSGIGSLTSYDGNASTFLPLNLRGSVIYAGNGNFGCGGQTSPGFPVDCTGDINTSTEYRVGGTIGLSRTLTVRNSVGTGTCTITVTGGIITASSC